VNYGYLTWCLFVAAWLIGQYVGSTGRLTQLIYLASCLAGTVVFTGRAGQGPGDWVNYFLAPWFFLAVVLWLIRPGRAMVRRRAGTGSH
jgi:hypothetical protein